MGFSLPPLGYITILEYVLCFLDGVLDSTVLLTSYKGPSGCPVLPHLCDKHWEGAAGHGRLRGSVCRRFAENLA